MDRLDWHDYFLVIAQAAARRATCPRLSVGAVAVTDKQIVGTGYNGSAPGEDHCSDVGCLMHEGHCLRTTHAESNALQGLEDVQALYCTHQPCYLCTKEIVLRGIKRVYYIDAYKLDRRRDLYLASLKRPPDFIQRAAPKLALYRPDGRPWGAP